MRSSYTVYTVYTLQYDVANSAFLLRISPAWDKGTFQLIYLSQERGLNAIVIRSCDAINIFNDKASVRVCLLKVNNKSAVTDRN